MRISKALEIAAQSISYVESQGLSEKSAFSKVSRNLPTKDTRTIKHAYHLFFESVKRLNFIDLIVERSGDRGGSIKYNRDVLNFLRILAYITKFQNTSLRDYVRYVLTTRNILGSNIEGIEEIFGELYTVNIESFFKDLEDEERIALRLFHPLWFVKYCIRRFGRSFALKILESNNGILPTYVLLNPLRRDIDNILDMLGDRIELKDITDFDYVFEVIAMKGDIIDSNIWKKGYIRFQDKSSFLAVSCLDPDPGDVILDACAAPGGKTAYLAALTGNKGRTYSLDYSRKRMRIWQEEVKRLKVKNAYPIICDVTESIPLKVEVDAALVDPPCSGTGTFMKTPMTKWRLDFGKVMGFQRLQLDILCSASRIIRTGGILVYSTCSIMMEENEHVIQRFLELHPDFDLEGMHPFIGQPGLEGLRKCQRLYPHIHRSNGFFIAKMRRIE